eukprot:m.191560 g.191560  ORF g.191560 m.191560 type:complete len:635 (+) comp10594_c0_seq3:67-1971(+)
MNRERKSQSGLLAASSSSSFDSSDEDDDPGHVSPGMYRQGGDVFLDDDEHELRELRYREAAIFLHEGERNIKFDSHPHSPREHRAYTWLHSHPMYAVELTVTLILLGLTVFEDPAAVPGLGRAACASIELVCLAVLGAELGLVYTWLGPKRFFSNRRALMKTFALLAMVAESIAELCVGRHFFRLTRFLRPFLLADNHYSTGLRRVLRQIAQTFIPVVDMLLLLLCFLFMFAVIGFYAFSKNVEDNFFGTLKDSFVSLFVLITTANYPDVMMPAFSDTSWAFFFFLAFLLLGLYFLMNLILAVVYDTFREKERTKFKKLLLHKRQALRYAYRYLQDRTHGGVSFARFRELMHFRDKYRSPLDVRLMFLALNSSESEYINLKEFYHFYEIDRLVWKRERQILSFDSTSRQTETHIPRWMLALHFACRRVVDSAWFDPTVYAVIILNCFLIIYDAAATSESRARKNLYHSFPGTDITFVVFYWIEVFIRFAANGPVRYWKSGWRCFDLFVTLISTLGLFSEFEVWGVTCGGGGCRHRRRCTRGKGQSANEACSGRSATRCVIVVPMQLGQFLRVTASDSSVASLQSEEALSPTSSHHVPAPTKPFELYSCAWCSLLSICPCRHGGFFGQDTSGVLW